MVRSNEMAGCEGNFTGMLSKGYLMYFITSTLKSDFSVWGTKQNFQWHWESGAKLGI